MMASKPHPYRPGEAWFLPANLPPTMLKPDGLSLGPARDRAGHRRAALAIAQPGIENQAISRVV